MTELDQLFIIGCPKVTHRGIGEIVSTNRNGLTGIGLERLSPAFVSLQPFAVITRLLIVSSRI
jgi:hypothetical protein